MICFHHNDLDGRCAAGIIETYFGSGIKSPIKYVETNYNRIFPLDIIEQNEVVYIVDYSIEPEIMEKLLKITTNITWIDHHKTADEYKYSQEITGLRITEDKKYSGCELVWIYLFGEESKMPMAVQLIGDRDKWAWKLTDTAAFNEGMKLNDCDPTSNIWKRLIYNDTLLIDNIIENGHVCIKHRDMIMNDYCNSCGWETTFEGYKCFANGVYMFGSEGFGNRFNAYDICISYEFTGDNWVVGLYSKTVDVGAIAQKYGLKYNTSGGGHKGAAGFVAPELPFKKIPKEV